MSRFSTLMKNVVRCAALAALVASANALDAHAQSGSHSSAAQWKNRGGAPPTTSRRASSSTGWAAADTQSARPRPQTAKPRPQATKPRSQATKSWVEDAAAPPAWNARAANSFANGHQPKRQDYGKMSARWMSPAKAPAKMAPAQARAKVQPPVKVARQEIRRAPAPVKTRVTKAVAKPKVRPAAHREAPRREAAPRADLRQPKAFAPPSDADQMARADEAPRPTTRPRRETRPAQSASTRPQSRHSSRTAARNTTRKQQLDDAGWIRPLQRTAYQPPSGPEELYAPQPSGPEVILEPRSVRGEIVEGTIIEGDAGWIDDHGQLQYGDPQYLDGCGDSCGDSCGCGDTCDTGGCGDSCGCGPEQMEFFDLGFGLQDPEACATVAIRLPKIQELVVFGGVHGFKGPYDQNRDGGNFGFQLGINVGAKLPLVDIGYQLGYQTTESQLSGDANTGDSSPFSQQFGTFGLFHRTRHGMQGGVVWDLLRDERDRTVEFEQMRAELSFVEQGQHEVGAMIAVHLDEYFNGQTNFQATDQYTVFYRMHGKRGGEGRIFAGLTDEPDAIVGANFLLPLVDRWSLESEFTYLIPGHNGAGNGARDEAWNIGINVVWHYQFRARKSHSNPYRPLFNVAGNGSLIIDRRP